MLIASVLVGGGVNSDELSTETIDYNIVAVCNDSLMFELPEGFTQMNEYLPGGDYFAYGYLMDSTGEETLCNVYVKRFFQAEELYLKYDTLKDFIVGTCHRIDSKNGELTFISEDYSFGGSAMGYITHFTVSNANRYSAYIKGEGAYYMVFMEVEGQIDENIPFDMLKSIEINQVAEQKAVDEFQVKVEGDRYYSASVGGVSIAMPYNWEPMEGERFVYSNCILAIQGNGSGSSITVQMVEKDLVVLNYLEVYDYLYEESIFRGNCIGDSGERGYLETEIESGISTIVELYDVEPAIFICVLQDDKYYYIVKGNLLVNDYDRAIDIVDFMLTFNVEGLIENDY